MANTCVWTLTVRGDGRGNIRELFELNAHWTDWGCVWLIPGYDPGRWHRL
jgi:hypothetical protein